VQNSAIANGRPKYIAHYADNLARDPSLAAARYVELDLRDEHSLIECAVWKIAICYAFADNHDWRAAFAIIIVEGATAAQGNADSLKIPSADNRDLRLRLPRTGRFRIDSLRCNVHGNNHAAHG
jgi:hypothetical protein